MYLWDNQKEKCCGCGACSQVCPKNCIEMIQDEDGFTFPKVDSDLCVNCRLCERVCPIEEKPVREQALEEPLLYAVRSREEETIMKSASGGAFTEIVDVLREQDDYYVWGAAFDENLKLKHTCIKPRDSIEPLKKSKYIQSDMQEAFAEIKEQLLNERKVLFSGTPCQVAALKKYLFNVNTEKLLCIDLLCHGVPSQASFDAYICEEEKNIGKKISNVQFRYKLRKKFKREWDSRNILLETIDGKEYKRNRFSSRYLRAYYSFIMNRQSCYACVYSNPERVGDITLGDFWGIEKFSDTIKEEKGISLVQVNTLKGKECFRLISERLKYNEVDREKYLHISKGAMVQPVTKGRNYKAFFDSRKKFSFNKSVDTITPYWKEWVKINIARKLSPKMRQKIKKLLRR